MATAVVVPWRSDGGHRDAAWSWVRDQYAEHHPDWEVVTGTCDGPWVKALAVADALANTDADTLLIADADVWCDGLRWAVDSLTDWPWAIPHLFVHRLTTAATAAVLAGGEPSGTTTQRPYKGYAGGGFMAVRRDVYQRAPLDPRFVGWGQEDSAWHLALTRIAGRGVRGRADCWHLFHEPQPRMSRIYGSDASQALLDRYAAARTPQAMTALLAEVTDASQDRAQPTRRAGAPAIA